MWKKLACAVTMVFTSVLQAQEVWLVTTLEWPPFSGKNLPEGGAGIVVLREALATQGVRLEVEFYPWTRALITAKNPRYAGVYPAWPEDVGVGFVSSSVLFRSPVGFVEPKVAPLHWTHLQDLQGKKIGVVQDYGNAPEFMHLGNNKTIKTEVVIDDLTNVRKVAGGRIDAAFIDLNNLAYYLKFDAKAVAHLVQANVKEIGSKDLVLAINRNFANRDANAILSRGLAQVDPDRILKSYMQRNFK
ncbi:transporter substrate-binding domain-containing protein [Janthinobacterium sp.]|uniref:substrate-binding periplasmic protein n=1 Tax=Janthinobacterium sp. TaxID=1871054 RepID=UPI00293D549B|nr:transporter substrate-binding domain-containing protein [Janthinobacterium sp.]